MKSAAGVQGYTLTPDHDAALRLVTPPSVATSTARSTSGIMKKTLLNLDIVHANSVQAAQTMIFIAPFVGCKSNDVYYDSKSVWSCLHNFKS